MFAFVSLALWLLLPCVSDGAVRVSDPVDPTRASPEVTLTVGGSVATSQTVGGDVHNYMWDANQRGWKMPGSTRNSYLAASFVDSTRCVTGVRLSFGAPSGGGATSKAMINAFNRDRSLVGQASLWTTPTQSVDQLLRVSFPGDRDSCINYINAGGSNEFGSSWITLGDLMIESDDILNIPVLAANSSSGVSFVYIDNSGGIEGWQIAVIVVCIFLGLCLIALAIFCLCIRQRREITNMKTELKTSITNDLRGSDEYGTYRNRKTRNGGANGHARQFDDDEERAPRNGHVRALPAMDEKRGEDSEFHHTPNHPREVEMYPRGPSRGNTDWDRPLEGAGPQPMEHVVFRPSPRDQFRSSGRTRGDTFDDGSEYPSEQAEGRRRGERDRDRSRDRDSFPGRDPYVQRGGRLRDEDDDDRGSGNFHVSYVKRDPGRDLDMEGEDDLVPQDTLADEDILRDLNYNNPPPAPRSPGRSGTGSIAPTPQRGEREGYTGDDIRNPLDTGRYTPTPEGRHRASQRTRNTPGDTFHVKYF